MLPRGVRRQLHSGISICAIMGRREASNFSLQTIVTHHTYSGGGNQLHRDANLRRTAADDKLGVVWYLPCCPKRRAWPEWALTAEAFLTCIGTRWSACRSMWGWGLRRTTTSATSSRGGSQTCCVREGGTGWTRLNWHRAQSYVLDKRNSVEGAGGTRFIHCFNSLGMGWFAPERYLQMREYRHPVSCWRWMSRRSRR